MIQRIQTVYLSLAFIAMALLFAFPLAQFFVDNINNTNGSYVFWITGLKNKVPDGLNVFNHIIFFPLIIVTVGIAILSLFTIFQYKNRSLQIKLTSIGVISSVALIMSIFFIYIPLIEKKVNIPPYYLDSIGIYLPLVALVFMVLANRAIKRDDKLVRSADRLR